jgi:hypothetical protein
LEDVSKPTENPFERFCIAMADIGEQVVAEHCLATALFRLDCKAAPEIEEQCCRLALTWLELNPLILPPHLNSKVVHPHPPWSNSYGGISDGIMANDRCFSV